MSTCSRKTEQNSEHRSEGNTIGRKKIDDGFKTPQARYDASNSVQMSLKLNTSSDADIIAALEGKAKQTEIKRLVRIGLAAEKHK